jgi:hypothetical protein
MGMEQNGDSFYSRVADRSLTFPYSSRAGDQFSSSTRYIGGIRLANSFLQGADHIQVKSDMSIVQCIP